MERIEAADKKIFLDRRLMDEAINNINQQFPNAGVLFNQVKNFCDEMQITGNKDLRRFYTQQREGTEHIKEDQFFEILAHICSPRSPFLFRVIRLYLDLIAAEKQ